MVVVVRGSLETTRLANARSQPHFAQVASSECSGAAHRGHFFAVAGAGFAAAAGVSVAGFASAAAGLARIGGNFADSPRYNGLLLAGTVTAAPHLPHLSFRPACSGSALNAAPHAAHLTGIDMV